MGKVFITDYIKSPAIERRILGDKLSDELNSSVEVLLVWHKIIDQSFIDSHPQLKGIVRYGVGYDNVDIEYAREKGISVCNTPDYGTDEVADTAMAMILGLSRSVFSQNERSRNLFTSWQVNVARNSRRSSETKLGVIGAGRIGGSVLLKSKAMKFHTFFYDPYQPRGLEKTLYATRCESLEELIGTCNIISIHTPLNEETNGMINPDLLNSFRKGSMLINTARGKLLSDIDILYHPLRSRQLAGAGLDVLPEEPPQQGLLIDAWRKEEPWLKGRLIINPHTAYYSPPAYREMRLKAAQNALRIIEGERPFNIVH